MNVPAATLARSMFLSLVSTSTDETVVVEPLTVKLPPILKLPLTALKESIYVLTAFCVATLTSLF